jgi:hypothetical protein
MPDYTFQSPEGQTLTFSSQEPLTSEQAQGAFAQWWEQGNRPGLAKDWRARPGGKGVFKTPESIKAEPQAPIYGFQEGVVKPIQTPLISGPGALPKDAGMGKGALYGAGDIASGLTSPENLALLLSGGALAKTAIAGIPWAQKASKAVAALFAGTMGYDTYKEAADLVHLPADQRNAGEVARRIVNMIGTGGMAALSAKAALAKHPFVKAAQVMPKAAAQVAKTKEVSDALQKRGAEALPLETPPGDSKTVGQGAPRPEEPAQAQAQGKEVQPSLLLTPGASPEGAETAAPSPDTTQAANVTPTAQGVAPEPVLETPDLLPEHRTLVDEEAAAQGDNVVFEAPTDPNEPFAGQIAQADRQRGVIRINPQELSKWLRTGVPKGQEQAAIRSVLSEERIHLATTDEDAAAYHDSLTPLERWGGQRIYGGPKWRANPLNPTMLGHEMLRMRMQQLARMDVRETIERVNKERWKVNSLLAMNDVVRGIRERIGTKASKEGMAILDRVQGNLRAAIASASGEQPAARRKYLDEETTGFFLPPMQEGETRPTATEAGALPPKPASITAEDIDWKSPQAYKAPDMSLPAPQLGKSLAQGGRVGGSQSGTTSRAVVALEKEGKVHVVQIYEHANLGTMVQDPTPKSAARPHASMSEILAKGYKPLAAFNLKQARRSFHEVFQSVKEYQKALGEPAEVKALEEQARRADTSYQSKAMPLKEEAGAEEVEEGGLPRVSRPLPYGTEAGYEPGREQYRLGPIEEPEARALLEHIERIAPNFDRIGIQTALDKIKARANPQIISALRKLGARLQARNPDMSSEQLVDKLAQSLYENHGKAQDLDDYIRRTVAEGPPAFGKADLSKSSRPAEAPQTGKELEAAIIRKEVPRGTYEPSPRPEPEVEQPTPQSLADYLESQREVKEPSRPAPVEPVKYGYKELQEILKTFVPKGRVVMGKTKPKVEFGPRGMARMMSPHPEPPIGEISSPRPLPKFVPVPEKEQAKLRAALAQTEADLKDPRKEPAAINKWRDTAEEEMRRAGTEIGLFVTGKGGREDSIARGYDIASNTPHINAKMEETGVRLASIKGEPTKWWQRKFQDWTRGNRDVLAAANVLVQSQFNRHAIPDFRRQVAEGRQHALELANSPNWRERRIGRAMMNTAKVLDKELNYAEAHWDDPDLQATAERTRDSMHAARQAWLKAGYDLKEFPGYVPQRYNAALMEEGSQIFSFLRDSAGILGKRFELERTFKTYYEAFSKGPYIPATRDIASLVSHAWNRVGQRIASDKWEEGLKAMRTEGGQAVALEPKEVRIGERKALQVPDVAGKAMYEMVDMGRGRMLAIHKDFAPLVRNLTKPSVIEDWPVTGAALRVSQRLKHSLLVGDFFHLGRMEAYAMATTRGFPNYRAPVSLLDFKEGNLQEAVNKGLLSQKDVDWAMGKVPFGKETITRRELAKRFYSEAALNVGRIQDALYKDLITNLTPGAGPVRTAVHAVVDPTAGRYNRFLFDELTRGFMTDAAVKSFERYAKANPDADPNLLMKDISRDVNNFFGNIGRQGWMKSKTMQDGARLIWLAPQWVEGLLKKELVAYSRPVTAFSRMKRGLPPMGVMGSGIGGGMVFLYGLTQAINLITRGHPTWMNPEPGRKHDAWIPNFGDEKGAGNWFSYTGLFNEMVDHVGEQMKSRKTFMEAVDQVAGNKESPLFRAGLIAAGAVPPIGGKPTTSIGQLKAAGEQVLPVPITFGRMARAGAHTVAPSMVSPPPPGIAERQAFASLGFKLHAGKTKVTEMFEKGRNYAKDNNLKPDSGWQQVETDEASYSRLRTALRNGDNKEAERQYKELSKTHTPPQILHAMKLASKRPFTGSEKAERQFLYSLTDEEREDYSKAVQQRLEQYAAFCDWLSRQSGQ